ncbi:MAG TPA: IS630 family transposase, partial [Longimicrobiaceae bacterium]|nr:IS630 family transposase [Longimicrobiaceae bacterium]
SPRSGVSASPRPRATRKIPWLASRAWRTRRGRVGRGVFPPRNRAELVTLGCQGPNPLRSGETHYTLRRLAADALALGLKISHEGVRQVLRAADLKPHRGRYWLTRTDPDFERLAAAVLDLYEHPPPGRLLCFDEKTQLQALPRRFATLPAREGQVERREFEYKRHGTRNLFCALDVADGSVFGRMHERKRAVEVLDFLRALRERYPGEVLHLILDNLSTHKTPEILAFLAEDGQMHLHFLPKHGSWLNQVELFFSVLARRVIRRGDFHSLDDLSHKILVFLDHWNAHERKPFRWSYTSAQLLAA